MNPSQSTHVWKLSFEGAWTTSVAFLGSHQKLAAGNREGDILLWDLPESPDKPAAFEQSPAAKGKSAAGKDKAGEPSDHSPARRLEGHQNAISHLVAVGDTLVSTSLDRTVRWWDVTAPSQGSTEIVLDQSRRELEARKLPSAKRAEVLDAPGAKVEIVKASAVSDNHTDWIKACGISRDQKRLITGDDACWSIVWDIETRQPICQWHGYDRVWVTSAALSASGELAFTAEFAGSRSSFDRPAAQARLWDVKALQETKELTETPSPKMDLLATWTPKAKERGDTYQYARAWGKLMGRGLVCSDFSPDNQWLAVGMGGEYSNAQVHLINVETGEIVRSFAQHQSGVCDVKFSGDGKYVLSSGRDTTVRITQADDGKEVATLGTGRGGQFKDWIHQIAISPDQRWVAGADIAGYVHVWRLS